MRNQVVNGRLVFLCRQNVLIPSLNWIYRASLGYSKVAKVFAKLLTKEDENDA